MNADRAAVMPVFPAAIAEPHFETRRQGQQPPRAVDFGQHAKPAGARDVVGIARDGKELVKRCVADGELRRENPVHPARCAKRAVARQKVLAAADDRSVAASHEAILLTQHGMPVPWPVIHEVGIEFAVPPLFMDAFGVRLFACLEADERLRILEDASDRSLQRRLGLRESFRRFFGRVDPQKISLACRLRMIRVVQAEKGPGRAFAGHQALTARLNDCASRTHAEGGCREDWPRSRAQSHPHRDRQDRKVAAHPLRSWRPRRSIHAPPKDATRPGPCSGGSSLPARSADGASTVWSMYCEA